MAKQTRISKGSGIMLRRGGLMAVLSSSEKLRLITFNQWRKESTAMNRQFHVAVGIGRVDLLSVWWWKGGRIGVTLFGFGFGVIL